MKKLFNVLDSISKWSFPFAHICIAIGIIHELLKPSESKWELFLIGVAVLMLIAHNFYLSYFINAENRRNEKEKNSLQSKVDESYEDAKRAKSYVDAYEGISNAFSEVYGFLLNPKNEDFEGCLNDFCTKLNDAYDNITGSKCHVVIKGFTDKTRGHDGKNDRMVKTIGRSKKDPKRKEIDSKGIEHWIYSNTDLTQVYTNVLDQNKACFFEPDLSSRVHYKDTCFCAVGNKHFQYFADDSTHEHRSKNWPLPYWSSVVVPITHSVVLKNTETGKQLFCLGFLIIDSDKKNAFNPHIDPIILQGCAEGLYYAIHQSLTLGELQPTQQSHGKINTPSVKLAEQITDGNFNPLPAGSHTPSNVANPPVDSEGNPLIKK